MFAYTIKDGAAPDADYILVNVNQMGAGATRTAVNTMFSRAEYGILMQGQGLYLFKRGHKSPDTKAAVSAIGAKFPKSWRH
jgi:hypothetical protein